MRVKTTQIKEMQSPYFTITMQQAKAIAKKQRIQFLTTIGKNQVLKMSAKESILLTNSYQFLILQRNIFKANRNNLVLLKTYIYYDYKYYEEEPF